MFCEVSMFSEVKMSIVRESVPVDKAELMDIIDGESRLRNVELRAIFRKCILLHEECHHITTRQELHYEVEVDRILAIIIVYVFIFMETRDKIVITR